ncbi:MAG TPA: DUF3618 domain-containing protein [Mycobacteriales bacterium]|nr:DUF3618 domain-containing protein [Mycobacteriales bacterium]
MGTQPEELEREIAQSRVELGRALDQIEQRLSPRRMARDNRGRIQATLGAIAALMAIMAGTKAVRSRRRHRRATDPETVRVEIAPRRESRRGLPKRR